MSLYSDGTRLISLGGGIIASTILNFIPQSGYSAIGSTTNGGTLTINGPGGFGTKPVDPRPLLVMMVNAADGLNPSPLGRTTSLIGVGGLTAVSGGGPGNGPYAAGAPTTSADAANQVQWTAGLDVDQWGAGSAALNDFGSKYYCERQIFRNFEAYSESTQFAISNITWNGGTVTVTTTAPCVIANGTTFQTTITGVTPSGYNGTFTNAIATGTNSFTYPLATNPGIATVFGTYNSLFNLKIVRWWSRNPDSVGGAETYPDLYMASNNYTLAIEFGSSSGNVGTPYTPVPQSLYTYQPYESNIDAISGGPPGSPNSLTYNSWHVESFETTSNLTAPSYTANGENLLDSNSMVFSWRADGINSNNPAFPTPVQTYQPNNWFIKGTDATADTGRMMRYYFWHVISEQYQGQLPLGSYVNFGPTIVEDSHCRIHARDSATQSAFIVSEFQIPSAWSDTSITMTLRQGRFTSGEQTPIIVTDNTGTEHYVGDIIWS